MTIDDLSYDPKTGAFMWSRSGKGVRKNLTAGTVNKNGYLYISIDGKSQLGHRLAWFMTHGRWPNDCIDHINGNRLDNRICNLREATFRENCQYRHAVTGEIPLLGVYRKRKRFSSEIRTSHGRKHLGTFDTPEAAHAAYMRARKGI